MGKYYYSNDLFSIGEIWKIKASIPGTWIEVYFAQNGDYRKTKVMLLILFYQEYFMIWKKFKYYILSGFSNALFSLNKITREGAKA